MMALADRAVALNPNSARSWALSAYLRIWAGQLDIALEHHEASDRLSPRVRVGTSAAAMGGTISPLAASMKRAETTPSQSRKIRAIRRRIVTLLPAMRIWAGSSEAREIVERLRTVALGHDLGCQPACGTPSTASCCCPDCAWRWARRHSKSAPAAFAHHPRPRCAEISGMAGSLPRPAVCQGRAR